MTIVVWSFVCTVRYVGAIKLLARFIRQNTSSSISGLKVSFDARLLFRRNDRLHLFLGSLIVYLTQFCFILCWMGSASESNLGTHLRRIIFPPFSTDYTEFITCLSWMCPFCTSIPYFRSGFDRTNSTFHFCAWLLCMTITRCSFSSICEIISIWNFGIMILDPIHFTFKHEASLASSSNTSTTTFKKFSQPYFRIA